MGRRVQSSKSDSTEDPPCMWCRPPGRRVLISKSDSTEDSSCMWACCKLNLQQGTKRLPLVWCGILEKWPRGHAPSSSSCQGSKLQGPPSNSPCVASKTRRNYN
ncbi:hypothetical protein AVEN_135503-1 [Araneus ventricosus]|uniref:Uncharacterized protein n=1 Tax=Araneus ventricosus TaxID=182803 RepID=A0A4Y2HNQ3_ARAVE|nr:hypothetical protein AVEN_135503-1 [Araneus ventricosus]